MPVQNPSITHEFQSSDPGERAKEMTPKVPSPRYPSAKFPIGKTKKKCPLQPCLLCPCWGWSSVGAKERLQEEKADPGHLDKSLQGSSPARLHPRDKREAELLRGTDTALISSCAGAVTVARAAEAAQGSREGGGGDGDVSIPKCSREISPEQLLDEGAAPRVYFTQGTGKRFSILKWEINPAEGPWGGGGDIIEVL